MAFPSTTTPHPLLLPEILDRVGRFLLHFHRVPCDNFLGDSAGHRCLHDHWIWDPDALQTLLGCTTVCQTWHQVLTPVIWSMCDQMNTVPFAIGNRDGGTGPGGGSRMDQSGRQRSGSPLGGEGSCSEISMWTPGCRERDASKAKADQALRSERRRLLGRIVVPVHVLATNWHHIRILLVHSGYPLRINDPDVLEQEDNEDGSNDDSQDKNGARLAELAVAVRTPKVIKLLYRNMNVRKLVWTGPRTMEERVEDDEKLAMMEWKALRRLTWLTELTLEMGGLQQQQHGHSSGTPLLATGAVQMLLQNNRSLRKLHLWSVSGVDSVEGVDLPWLVDLYFSYTAENPPGAGMSDLVGLCPRLETLRVEGPSIRVANSTNNNASITTNNNLGVDLTKIAGLASQSCRGLTSIQYRVHPQLQSSSYSCRVPRSSSASRLTTLFPWGQAVFQYFEFQNRYPRYTPDQTFPPSDLAALLSCMPQPTSIRIDLWSMTTLLADTISHYADTLQTLHLTLLTDYRTSSNGDLLDKEASYNDRADSTMNLCWLLMELPNLTDLALETDALLQSGGILSFLAAPWACADKLQRLLVRTSWWYPSYSERIYLGMVTMTRHDPTRVPKSFLRKVDPRSEYGGHKKVIEDESDRNGGVQFQSSVYDALTIPYGWIASSYQGQQNRGQPQRGPPQDSDLAERLTQESASHAVLAPQDSLPPRLSLGLSNTRDTLSPASPTTHEKPYPTRPPMVLVPQAPLSGSCDLMNLQYVLSNASSLPRLEQVTVGKVTFSRVASLHGRSEEGAGARGEGGMDQDGPLSGSNPSSCSASSVDDDGHVRGSETGGSGSKVEEGKIVSFFKWVLGRER